MDLSIALIVITNELESILTIMFVTLDEVEILVQQYKLAIEGDQTKY
jgi:hypothetical protein